MTKEVEVVEATLGGPGGWAPGCGMGAPLAAWGRLVGGSAALPLGWLESLVVGGLEGMKLERAVRLMGGPGGGTTGGGFTGVEITGAVWKGEGRDWGGSRADGCSCGSEPVSAVA